MGYIRTIYWLTGCTLEFACQPRQMTGAHLTTLFGAVESAEMPLIETVARKKHGWLPILTVLFLISYALMTMLIMEQGKTIESQRGLIRELFRDTNELSALKLKVQEKQAQALHSPASPIPSTQAPSSGMAKGRSMQAQANQTPSTQTPSNQTQPTQADPQVRTRNRPVQQKPFHMPSRPESDLTDSSRSLVTI